MRDFMSRRSLVKTVTGAVAAMVLSASPAAAQATIKFGLVAALSGQSAKSGEAITRGLSLAIDEINAKGGILGKTVELSRGDGRYRWTGCIAPD